MVVFLSILSSLKAILDDGSNFQFSSSSSSTRQEEEEVVVVTSSNRIINRQQQGKATRTTTLNRICPDICFNGNNCNNEQCKDCFFSCLETNCKYRKITCRKWCAETSDCNDRTNCGGCLYCQQKVTETCPHGTFKDVTAKVFGRRDSSDYWYEWLHSGKSYLHTGAPIFTDVNGDGIMDYFNPMHGQPPRFPFKNRMELGIGSLDSNGVYSLRKVSERIKCTDAVPCFDQWSDTHGPNMVDLDGDGILDIYISNGGGEFLTGTKWHDKFDNWLFWGSKQIDSDTNEEITIFKGGRDAARAAGVAMKLGRGRFNYIFDANGDGLLDIFCSNSRRVSNEIRPGILLLNQGNRTWKEDTRVMEYARTMMITDANGDGIADDFLVNRSFCYPQRSG